MGNKNHKKQSVIQKTTNWIVSWEQYEWPTPPKEIIETFERLNPGSAERLLTTYEKVTEHTIKQEKKALEIELLDLQSKVQLTKNEQTYEKDSKREWKIITLIIIFFVFGLIFYVIDKELSHYYIISIFWWTASILWVSLFLWNRKNK
jgi:uncharacterized membrane protein